MKKMKKHQLNIKNGDHSKIRSVIKKMLGLTPVGECGKNHS